MSEKLIEGLRERHRRDSAELRRLCAERDQLRAEVQAQRAIAEEWCRKCLAEEARLDWLADRDNAIGNVQLPTAAVLAHPECMRAAIDAAMEMPQDWPKDDDL